MKAGPGGGTLATQEFPHVATKAQPIPAAVGATTKVHDPDTTRVMGLVSLGSGRAVHGWTDGVICIKREPIA